MKLRQHARDLAARSMLGLSICVCCLPGIAAASPPGAGHVGIIFVGNAAADTPADVRAALDSLSNGATDTLAAEVVAFYEGRGYQPAWSGSDEAAGQAHQVETVLRHAYEQGLRSEDYPVSAASNGASATSAAAISDIVMTASLLRYAHDVRIGRVTPNQIYRDVALVPQQYDAVGALTSALQSNAIADYLADLPPTHPGYVGLVKALARYSQTRQDRTSAVRAQQIAANMERWRWLPREMESRYIAVDVPDQSVEYIRDGQSVLKSRVIIGRPDAQTPILETAVQAVIANPAWDIPDDIAARMITPHLGSDPGYLTSKNIVFENGQYRQNPGPDNGLGLVMLDVPNPFWVYLHDTPNKKLFDAETREFSNGCVRVQQIFSLASLVLTDDPDAGLPQLQQAIGLGQTQRIPLSSPLPVYMLYWTARADENGNVEFSPDRYHRDPPLIAALGFHLSPHAAEKKQEPAVKPKPKPETKSTAQQVSLHLPKSAAH